MDRNPLYLVHSQQLTSEGVVTRRVMIFRTEEAAEKFSKIQSRTVTDPDAPEVYKKQIAMLNERRTLTVDGNKLIVTVINDREFMKYEKKHEKEISAWLSKREKEFEQERKERMRQAEESRKEQEKQQP